MGIQVLVKALASSLVIATLAGCGAGESDAATPELKSQTSSNDSASQEVARHEPVSEHCGDPVSINAEMIERINELRASSQQCGNTTYQAVSPVQFDARLENAAIVHADDMATENFFSHTGSDGSSFDQRIQRQGYADNAYMSENLANAFTSVNATVSAWMQSTSHCKAIMATEAKELGAACIYQEESDHSYYWALELGDE